MNTGNRTIARQLQPAFRWAGLILLLCYMASAHAIDNPDAPDHVGEFLNRISPFEQKIEQTAYTSQQYAAAYADYERFLNSELDTAYQQLMDQLGGDIRVALQTAQQQWMRYREQEFEFITANWNIENFGSSSIISRGSYRTTLLKDRIIQLLHYLQNYSLQE